MKHSAIADSRPPGGDPRVASADNDGAQSRRASAETAKRPRQHNAISVGSWLGYPAVVGLGVALYLWMTAMEVPVTVSAYLTVALGAVVIVALEHWIPHRSEWRGTRASYKTDFLYLVLVQMSLPVLLALAANLALRNQLGHTTTGLWPHSWPLGFQVVLMILVADGLRYWLHVAAHRYQLLWRLHAVHHSPRNLYWLNVARFHPLEKTLQYGLDSLPFVLLGVHQEVIALYLVFYALNGFLQHCNIELRLGWLNYLISGPELHRWHHSRLPRESAVNFGNNLIVWDLIFGTRYLPRRREVKEIGLLNRNYPDSIGEQLKAPFIRGIEHNETGVPSWRGLAVNLLIVARMMVTRCSSWRSLVTAASTPREAQLKVLERILTSNQRSQFCSDHALSSCTSYEDYRQRVPVQTYETLRPYVEEHLRTGTPQLTAETPVMYAQTSGTTGEPKYIPILPEALEDLRRSQALATLVQYRAVPGAYGGRLLVIVSPAVEGHLENGVPYGSASGQIFRTMPAVLRDKYVIPPEVFEIDDYDLKYHLILRLAVGEKNITAAGTSNPSTFLKLLSVLREQRLELLRDIENGTFSRLGELPGHVLDVVRPRLRCSQARLRELRSILLNQSPSFKELWPHLKLFATWTGGNCGIALESVRAALPTGTRIMELGYIASELRGTITVDPASRSGLPTLDQHFFEFVEKQRWEREERQFLTLDELVVGCEYYVVITTLSGLYRYLMNDIVRVTGRFHSTPTIEFLQKGKGVTSITGEKLYESQVIEAVKRTEKELGFTSRFFVMLADVDRTVYRLLFEMPDPSSVDFDGIAGKVDGWLRKLNMEYAQKRESGRLKALELFGLVRGTGEAYKKFCIKHGQREGQFKTLTLQYRDEFPFPYDRYSPGSASGEKQ